MRSEQQIAVVERGGVVVVQIMIYPRADYSLVAVGKMLVLFLWKERFFSFFRYPTSIETSLQSTSGIRQFPAFIR